MLYDLGIGWLTLSEGASLLVNWGTVNWGCARRFWQSLGMGQLGNRVCGRQGRKDGQREAPSTGWQIYLFNYERLIPHTFHTSHFFYKPKNRFTETIAL